jgi:hypothetical protein
MADEQLNQDGTPKVAPATPEAEQTQPAVPTPGVDTTGEEAKGNVVQSGTGEDGDTKKEAEAKKKAEEEKEKREAK